MASHSSIIAWRIPWTEEPGGLQSMGSQRVGHSSGTMLYFQVVFLKNSFLCQVFCSILVTVFNPLFPNLFKNEDFFIGKIFFLHSLKRINTSWIKKGINNINLVMLLVNLLNYIYICLKMTYIYMHKNCFLLSIEKMPGIYTYIFFFPQNHLYCQLNPTLYNSWLTGWGQLL